jgi:hypothetical protein
VTGLVHPGSGYQRRETGDETQRLKYHMDGANPVWNLSWLHTSPRVVGDRPLAGWSNTRQERMDHT